MKKGTMKLHGVKTKEFLSAMPPKAKGSVKHAQADGQHFREEAAFRI